MLSADEAKEHSAPAAADISGTPESRGAEDKALRYVVFSTDQTRLSGG